jgi:hypothetical protein
MANGLSIHSPLNYLLKIPNLFNHQINYILFIPINADNGSLLKMKEQL